MNISILESSKLKYENEKKNIEEGINETKKKYEKLMNEFEERKKKVNAIKKGKNVILKGSMLMEINDFGLKKDIFNSKILFAEDEIDETKTRKSQLLLKNWKEICYIYDDYDLHEVDYELKAVGLDEHTYFSHCSLGFYFDTVINILNFGIDGKKSE